MKELILYRLINGLWAAIVLFIVSLALYVSMGRFLMGNVAQFQDDILRELNARLNFVVEADTLRGRWESRSPTSSPKPAAWPWWWTNTAARLVS